MLNEQTTEDRELSWVICFVCVCFTERSHTVHGAWETSDFTLSWWMCRRSLWSMVSLHFPYFQLVAAK